MRVTLIRHGEAEDHAPTDSERALTKRGRTEARRVGRALARHGVHFRVIVTSPLIRAVQTAEIVAAAMGSREPIIVDRALVPDATAAGVRTLLRGLGDAPSVALVAHEPILSGICAVLLGTVSFPALRKMEAIRIRLEGGPDGPGRLRWRIDPASGKRRRS
ncbi:MAG TPA: phosphohistidine phosphatase SixA [Polyangia bacterium]|jgi:phosphohistidine phosphatase|nr:phosphohistidine phosphatase SixA [Polyangia bacterium]